MTWNEFYKALESGKIGSVYCFSGPEEYVKKSALGALAKKLLPEGLEALNETMLDGGTARQIIEAAETLPMMCERRLVVVRDWAPLLSSKAKNASAEADEMAAWLANAPDSCTVVFYVHGLPDGRTKAMQAMQKGAMCVSFDLLTDERIMKWVQAQLKPLGKRMEPRAVEMLTFMAGRELTRLDGELQKLAAYVDGRDVIGEADVEVLVSPSLECTVFQMIDALMAGRKLDAHKLVKSMLEAGENSVGVLFMLTRQLRNLTHIKLLKGKGKSLSDIERQMGLNHFAAQQAERQTAKFSLVGLESGYKACLDAEFAIKSGSMRDTLALDQIMLALGEMK